MSGKPWCLLATAVFSAVTSAGAQIYVNGSLSTGATTESGVAAPAGANWSELQHPTGDLSHSNTTLGTACSNTAATNFRCADDFTVPVGSSGWTVTHVEVFAYRTGAPATPSPITAGTLRIWNQPPNAALTGLLCGDRTTNVLVSSTDELIFRVGATVSPPANAPGTTRRVWRNRLQMPAACATASFFLPGTYWVDWDTTSGAELGHFAPLNVVLGARTVAGWNAVQDTTGAEGWAAVLDLGSPDAAAPDVAQDLPFQLFGTTPVALLEFEVE